MPTDWDLPPDRRLRFSSAQGRESDNGQCLNPGHKGIDPLLPGALCRAVLAAAEDKSGPAVIRQLAAITRHCPGLAVSEECADGGCGHQPCTYPDSQAVCWTCSLRTGEEAGEWAGHLMEECTVTAPCGVLAALAAHYGLAAVISR